MDLGNESFQTIEILATVTLEENFCLKFWEKLTLNSKWRRSSLYIWPFSAFPYIPLKFLFVTRTIWDVAPQSFPYIDQTSKQRDSLENGLFECKR